MISEKFIEELQTRWGKHGFVYKAQKRRLEAFDTHCCPHLKGMRVLELACNNGVFGYLISQVAKSYIGIDINPNYIKQAGITKKFCKNMKFFVSGITELKRLKFNALVANFCLYRFSNDEIKRINAVLPKLKVVCVQNRIVEKERIVNKYGFRKTDNIVNWLKSYKFKCEVTNCGDFDCIVGKR